MAPCWQIVVVGEAAMLRKAWGGETPDVVLTERIDDGLLAEGVVPQLRRAVVAFGSRSVPRTAPRHVIPRAAAVSAVACQLGFENVDGFGLDGLGVDLRPFDALRPSGKRARQHPGYWPVRLLPVRQPHLRLSRPFAAAAVHFGELCAQACVAQSDAAAASLDFASREADVSSREVRVEVTADGLLNAIVCWFDLEVMAHSDPSRPLRTPG